jgi:ATP-dependent Zn protease
MSQQGTIAPRGSTHQPRPKPSERTTRAPATFWDRIRIFLLLMGSFLVIVWARVAGATIADPPQDITFREALRDGVRSYWWLLVLASLEVVRQLHYLLEEHSPAYYAWWQRRLTGRDERLERMNPYVRYRLGRLGRLLFLLLIADIAIYAFASSSNPSVTIWNALVLAPALLVKGLPVLFQFAFLFFVLIIQFVGMFWFLSRGGMDLIPPDEIETRFSDVMGQDAAVNQLKETLVFMEDPEEIEAKGGYIPGGILLWGPPGTGKTLMAKAVAGETGKPFMAVEPSAFIQMFVGIGPLKVKSLYRKLRKLSLKHGGVIVFFDEADSLGNRGQQVATGADRAPTPIAPVTSCNGLAYLSDGARRTVFADAMSPTLPRAPESGTREAIMMGGMMGGGGGTLQMILSEMDGLEKPRGLGNKIRKWLGMKALPPPKYRILHVFATNLPAALDQAMLRPGRIDRSYKVSYPQKEGRKATFDYYLAKVKNDVTEEQVDQLATITPYFSGAAIKDIVNEGLVIAIRDGREVVTLADIVRAKQVKQHGLPDEHEYIERERHSVAVHEACHAVVAHKLRKHAVIDMATIERRGDVGGFVSSIPPEDQFVQWRSHREVDIMSALASLAGERLFFEGDHSTGVGGDMRMATAIATEMAAYYAMGGTIAARSVNLSGFSGATPMETGTDRALFDTEFGREVEAALQGLYERTWTLLEDNKGEVLALAHALETHKTLTGDDVVAVMEGTVGPEVDGRPYQDVRFRQELFVYHEQVVQAHKESAGVEGSIPVPVPPAPVEVAPSGSRVAAGTMAATPVEMPGSDGP